MATLRSLVAVAAIATSSCSQKSDTDQNAGIKSPGIPQLYRQVADQLPPEATPEDWEAALSSAVPVESYATNRFQPPLANTDPAALRLSEKTTLKVGMPWFINGEVAPFFVAQAKGYYDAVNLEIEIVPGGPGVDHSLSLISNNVDIALIADPLRIFSIITSETGAAVTCIGALYPAMPTAFIGINSEVPVDQASPASPSIADLAGSHIGILPGYDNYLDYLEFKYQGEHSFSRRMRIGGSMSPVMLGKIDWAVGWISFQARELEREGFLNWQAIYYRDIAFDVPCDIILAKNEDLEKRQAELRAFLWATAKGKAFQIENHALAANITNRLQPQDNVVSDQYLIRRFQLEAATFNPEPGDEPLFMDLDKWSYAFAELARSGVLE